MPSLPQRVKQRFARKRRHEIAGKATDRAKTGCTRTRRARPSLMIVAVTHDADTIALLEGIMQNPFEGAPCRVYLNGALQPAIMGILQVRVTSTDMCDDNGVFAFKLAEQCVGRVDGVCRGLPFNQNVR